MQSDRKPVVAVDFDGCLCVNRWPEIGEANTALIDQMKKLQGEGVQIILWTCREGEALEKAVLWCRERGLVFDAVNDNTEEQKAFFGNNCRKVGADMYIDDRALNISAEDARRAAMEMEGEAREPAEDPSFGYPMEGRKVIGYRYDPKGRRSIDCCGVTVRAGPAFTGGAIGRIRRILPMMKRRKP